MTRVLHSATILGLGEAGSAIARDLLGGKYTPGFIERAYGAAEAPDPRSIDDLLDFEETLLKRRSEP